jgi:hypothetical protein
MKTETEKLINAAQEVERYLLALRERLEARNRNVEDSKDFQYNKAKLHGLLVAFECFNLDQSEFSWIYYY